MLDAFLIFICGAFAMRVLQFFLAITPNFTAFKYTETCVIRILAELHINKLTAMKILEICYRDADKLNEWYSVENEVNKRYDSIIKDNINKLKSVIPYKIEYNNLREAVASLLKEKNNV